MKDLWTIVVYNQAEDWAAPPKGQIGFSIRFNIIQRVASQGSCCNSETTLKRRRNHFADPS